MLLSLIKSALKNKIFWYLASRYLVLGIQFLASILLAVKLGAYHFGVWSFILLLINIGTSCNWGIGTAMTVLLVQHKEDSDLCRSYTFNSFFLILLTFIPPLLILCYDRIIGIPFFEKYHLGNLIYAVTAVVLLQYICNFLVSLFRVQNKIISIIIQQSLWPLCMFLLIFCASGEHLLDILTFSYAGVLFLLTLIFMLKTPISWSLKPDSAVLKKIAGKAFFLFLYNVCFLLIVLSTKLQISYFCSIEDFGYFSFAFALAQGIMLLLDSMIFLLFPKMVDMLKGNDNQKIISAIELLRKNYILPLNLLFYAVLAASPVFFYFLPQYSKSLLPFILILFTLLMYSHCFGYNSYILAQNKELQFSLIVLGALVLNNIFVYGFIKLVNRAEYVVLGTLAAYTIYSLIVNCYALYCLKERKIAAYIRKNIPLTLLTLYAVTLSLILIWDQSYKFTLLSLLIFILLNFGKLKEVVKGAVKLIRNEKLINV